jgi:hypothetical protein
MPGGQREPMINPCRSAGPLLRRWECAPGTASAAGLVPLCAVPGTYVHDH